MKMKLLKDAKIGDILTFNRHKHEQYIYNIVLGKNKKGVSVLKVFNASCEVSFLQFEFYPEMFCLATLSRDDGFELM